MKKFLFVDLDDTLFQTLAKCGSEQNLTPAAYYADGSVCSFATPTQRVLFEFFQQQTTIIPTTARSYEAFQRVNLPFNSYAILQFGGVILMANGSLDKQWQAIIAKDLAEFEISLRDLQVAIDAFQIAQGLTGRARLIAEFEQIFYVNIKDPEKNTTHLDMLQNQFLEPWLAEVGRNFIVHRNGNNLAVLPAVLNKARAVNYVNEMLRRDEGAIMTLGLGDSLTDAGFMAACDYAIIPQTSQLAKHTLKTL